MDIYLSSNSWLAWWINHTYYNDAHYVWCAPATFSGQLGYSASSNPTGLCNQYAKAVQKHDGAAPVISQNKTGILKGVNAKVKSGVISQAQAKQIRSDVKKASLIDFRPLLYIIPVTNSIRTRARQPHPLIKTKLDSEEYVVADLDVLEFSIFPYLDN